MVSLALNIDIKEAKSRVNDAIASGNALNKMKEWLSLQGGDISKINQPELLLNAKCKKEYKAKKCGYISNINAECVGIASMLLGAGRAKKDDIIDYSAGIELKCRYGEYVNEGDTICVLYSSNDALFEGCEKKLNEAFSFDNQKPSESILIYDTL